MKCTEERKGISLRTKEYYELLLDTYKDDAFITLAYFHIHDMLNETKERYEKCLLDLDNCPENAKKKRFTLEELKSWMKENGESAFRAKQVFSWIYKNIWRNSLCLWNINCKIWSYIRNSICRYE